eukprot:XP_014778324.1 PREDICTED: NACHT and WD repeat domain-containing protein 2-like [Octopus bimaculoides]
MSIDRQQPLAASENCSPNCLNRCFISGLLPYFRSLSSDENEEEEEEEAKQELTPEELAERERKEKERRERLYRLLIGCMQNLPSLGSKIVRIFTSSTFTDTTVERNALMERIYPKIKDFCRERYGLEFQVVDMRWGVRDEATDDHMTTQLCMQEIDNCQRLSMGPNFVVLLGQKYGYRPIPTLILATEFEMLRDCIKEEASELELLEMWYKRDDNYVPPVYVLQPISSILTNFNNKRHQRLQEADQATWWETFSKLTKIIRKAAQVSSWFTGNKKPVMILRFLGTTPCSSSIVPLLTTLSRQLSYIYDIQEEEVPDELAPLIQHFKKVMCSATAKKPLIIFLDSLDQLSAASGAHELSWVPRKLAPNVKLIVSTLPNYYNILENLNTIVESKENYVQILPLGHNLSSTILKHWLKNANRNITNEQWEVVNEAISKCNLPLYVKLVFDEICRWKSYKKPQPNQLGHSIHDSITKLLEKIENQHGKTLVAHALGYITASKNGLSETELEDLLSLDEKVLNDVYQYHLPPTRRIPPLLWTRIRNDLPGYLSEREADGVNVIGWYHRQFIDAAKERYLKNLNFVSEIHSNLAEYFIGTWGGGIPKPFEYSELQRQRFNLDDKHGEGDRKVPLQPLVFNNAEGVIVTRYNLRKLSELPYSLIRSYRYEDLYEKVIFNYRWLHAKLSSMPLQSLLADLEDLLEHTYDKEVKLIADAIRLSSSVLNHYPDMLGPQIIGRLLPYYNSHQKIHSLIDQCESEGLNNCALIPGHHCLQTPGGPLQYSLEGHPFAPFGIAVTTDGRYVVSVSNKFIIWDLSSGDVVRTVSPKIEGIMQNLSISPSDKYAVGYTNNKQIVICLIYTGDYYIINEPDGKFKGQVLGATVSNSHLAVWKEKEWYLMTIEGKFLNSFESELKMPILLVTFTEKGNNLVFLKNDDEDNNAMTLEISDHSVEPFEFHSGIVLTKEQTRLYTCIEISDNAVVSYKLSGNRWRYERTLDNNTEPVFSMALAPDEAYLLVTIPFGYKLYDLKKDTQKDLKLPHGVRNIPTKNQIFSLLAFTKNNHFVVAGVRRNLYVWDVKQGNMVKVLDAHFGRIIAMDAVRGKNNKVISSSIDKTIKVWNFDNILEDVHSIDRLEKPIESMNIAENVNLCVTTTRNGVGVWDMERGKLVHNLPGGSHNSIISSALITKDGKYVVVAESVGVVVWDAKTGKMMKKIAQANTQVVLLNDDNTRVISFSVVSEEKGHGSCFIFPDGDEVYRFDYAMKKFLKPVLTCSSLQLAVPATDKSCDTINIYNAKTGHLQFTMQLKYSNYKDIQEVVAMPHEAHQIAVVDSEKGNIIDLKKKTLIRSVMRWNGMSTKNGKHGLYAPSRGGMELLELKHGKTIRTFIPKVAEGVFNIQVFFAKNDQHVVYYHSGRRTIRVFRVSDAKMIANFKTHAAVNTMACNALGTSIVIGTVDGSVTLLTIADPEYQENLDYLRALPARQALPVQPPLLDANGEIISSKDHFGATLHISRFVAKAGIASQKQQSKACVLS